MLIQIEPTRQEAHECGGEPSALEGRKPSFGQALWGGLTNLISQRPVLAIFQARLCCDSSCGYCNLPLNVGRYEMSRDEIRQVFTELYKEGVRFVFLQGGEPLLRSGLVSILQDLVQIGFHITLITNGTRLTSNLVEALNKLKVSLSIGLDTHDPIKYARIRGADQLDHVLAGLELLRGYQSHPSRRLLAASKGRALQMNAGAKQARREWLLFLHADTALPVGALQRLNEMETDQAIQVDGFMHRFSGDDWRLRFISFL